MPEFYFLYGPSGAGKSALGSLLAKSLDLPFVDLDLRIETQAGRAIPDIFQSETETGFRAWEKTALQELLLKEKAAVVSLGGGALLDPENRSRVEAAGEVLLLTAPLNILTARLEDAAAGSERPLLAGDLQAKLAGLLGSRQAHYESFGNRLDTGRLSLEEATWQAQVKLGRFRVHGMGAAYDVCARHGVLSSLGSSLRRRGLAGPVGLVSDKNIWALYGPQVRGVLEDAGYRVREVVIHPGESQKTIVTVQHIWAAFLSAGLERNSTVVALGGGVVGDLAGFSAATYKRGIPWVAVPTTLLAMVDASLGGKTGVDLPQGKNLVGAFHPPRLVLADPGTLATLTLAELRSGMAEVVKHGVIADPELYELCERGWEFLVAEWERVVRRAIGVKVRIVQEDPFEKGRRAALNLGHTIGHALEHASGFRLRHGEAIAIGMVMEARLAERLAYAEPGLVGRIERTLGALGLPVAAPPGLEIEAVLEAMGHDKKKTGGQVRFALPCRVGEVRIGVPVEDLRSALGEGG